MKKLQLSKLERKKLELEHSNISKAKHIVYPYKILSVLLYSEYQSLKKVSSVLRLNSNTIKRYVKKYRTYGIDGLMSDNYIPYSGILISEWLVPKCY